MPIGVVMIVALICLTVIAITKMSITHAENMKRYERGDSPAGEPERETGRIPYANSGRQQ